MYCLLLERAKQRDSFFLAKFSIFASQKSPTQLVLGNEVPMSPIGASMLRALELICNEPLSNNDRQLLPAKQYCNCCTVIA